MPPKKAAAGDTPNDGQRGKDAAFIFDSLFNIANPVVFNVGEIAQQTGAKANTVAKRFSILRNRYPGLNIQTTSVAGNGGSATVTNAAPPPTPKLRKGSSGGTASTKGKAKNKTPAKVEVEDDGDDVQDDDAANGVEVDDEEENVAYSPDTPATPAGALTDNNLADDEKTVKKPRGKAASANTAKPRAKAATTQKTTAAKRKRADDTPATDPDAKKAKVVKQPRKGAKSKTQAAEPEDEEAENAEASDDDETTEQEDKKKPENGKRVPSDDKNLNSTSQKRQINQADLALDVVQEMASRSRGTPYSLSPQKFAEEMKRSQEAKKAYVESVDEGDGKDEYLKEVAVDELGELED